MIITNSSHDGGDNIPMFKIVDMDKKYQPKFLFHGIGGNKVIPTDKTIQAKESLVKDGTGGTQYLSGIHVLKDVDTAVDYLLEQNFVISITKIIVPVFCSFIRRKVHARSEVWLASNMILFQKDWNQAISIKKEELS